MTAQEIRSKINELRNRLQPINNEIAVAERDYAQGVNTLKEMGIEVDPTKKIDLSIPIAEAEKEIIKAERDAEDYLTKAEGMIQELNDEIDTARSQ